MQILLVEDGSPHRGPYQVETARALESAWSQSGHSILRVNDHVLMNGRDGGPARMRVLDAAALELLDRCSAARVHMLTTGPVARAMARACAGRGRSFTSTSIEASIRAHERRAFEDAADSIHAAALRVVTPVDAGRRLLQSAGIDSALVVTAGVDTTQYQPRVYSYLDLPRPISLMLGDPIDEEDLDAFLESPLPGTRLVYAPDRPQLEVTQPVRVLGALSPGELAQHISAADVCVIPSRGPEAILRSLQALACGVPVAVRSSDYIDEWLAREPVGKADEDLGRAVTGALNANRQICRSVALRFAWAGAAARILDAGLGRAYPDREVA